jgi:hypothetical protein
VSRPVSYNVEPRFGGPQGCWSSWTVRPMGGKKGVKTFSYRKAAIAFAVGLRHCRYVFVHTLDGTVDYVKRVARK